ncbi:carbohydrate ABC transporter membrane protein 1, CUT1 family [Marinitoga hydrogenitolerans DSM 16785]|uniref:Carbohydrate ABC transporter membrane protein 1, CUT1 family n=1 Tax=Marinitoga hydrogenitolerans (strain DSM 16785 / JCM 12826 / AT1271) TaxID=1122195 RepID=A0A1M4XEY2_MARH1|nr:sugar ABC transporter permease [Marinitoga hydrogenitolerans]SHE92167.1 carbohydrate ABC transporter membrane protein 1, CUT1 family [Marinitoga hydrogenitolerans DSM 16785]
MKQRKFIILMLLPTILLISFIILYPTISGVLLSFKNYSIFNFGKIKWVGFENYKEIFSDIFYIDIVWNTIKWIFFSVFFQLIFGFILALLMKEPFKGRGLYAGFVFYPWAISGFAIGLIWSWLLNGQFGVINDILLQIGFIKEGFNFLSDPSLAMFSVILVNVWYGIPFFAIMILAALQSIPDSLYEAAEIDGAGYFTKLFKITIPYIKPTLINTILLRIIWVMNFPDVIYGMTRGGPAGSTEILSVKMINTVFYESNYSKAAAHGVIIVTVLVLYTIMYLKLTSKKEFSL